MHYLVFHLGSFVFQAYESPTDIISSDVSEHQFMTPVAIQPSALIFDNLKDEDFVSFSQDLPTTPLQPLPPKQPIFHHPTATPENLRALYSTHTDLLKDKEARVREEKMERETSSKTQSTISSFDAPSSATSHTEAPDVPTKAPPPPNPRALSDTQLLGPASAHLSASAVSPRHGRKPPPPPGKRGVGSTVRHGSQTLRKTPPPPPKPQNTPGRQNFNTLPAKKIKPPPAPSSRPNKPPPPRKPGEP